MEWWTHTKLRSRNAETRRQALEQLAAKGSAQSLRLLLTAVADADRDVRIGAIEVLGRSREEQALPPLINALRDSDAEVRAGAATALMHLADARAIEPLVTMLKDPHAGVRWHVAKALDSLGWRPADETQTALRLAVVGQFSQAASLGSVAVEPLAARLQDADNDVREAAVEALGQLRNPRAIAALVPALADAQSPVRQAAAAALRKIDQEWERSDGAREAIPQLEAALKHREYWVRQSAADALARITDLRAHDPQLKGLSQPEEQKRQALLAALTEMTGDFDRDLRQAAAEALGRIGDARTTELLLPALKDPDLWVRQAAARSLESLRRQSSDQTPGAQPRAAFEPPGARPENCGKNA